MARNGFLSAICLDKGTNRGQLGTTAANRSHFELVLDDGSRYKSVIEHRLASIEPGTK